MSFELSDKWLIAAALGATAMYALQDSGRGGRPSRGETSAMSDKLDTILSVVTKMWKGESEEKPGCEDNNQPPKEPLTVCNDGEKGTEEEDDYFHVRYYSSVEGMGILKKVTENMTAADLMYDRVFAKISRDTSAIEALGLLSQHRTSCLCVEDEEGKLRGIVDITDVTSFLTQSIVGTAQPIRGILRHCAFVKGSMPLNSVVSVMQRGWTYVAVEGAEGEYYDIVSQGLVLRYIHSHLKVMEDNMPSELHQTIQDVFAEKYTEVTCVSEQSTSRHAFNTMLSSGGRCILVTEDGRCDTAPKGVLSMSDIKVLSKCCDDQTRIDSLLSMPVLSFVETSRSEVGVSRPSSDIVRCAPTSSLMDVLDAMVLSDVHNVYVIDDETKPIGIISTSDLLRVLLV